MSERAALVAGGTRISWAHYTFNPWRGCVKVSPACRFCYAERDTARWGGDFWGKNAERAITKTTWGNPRKWDREAAEAGEQRRVFAASLADVFEDRDDLVDARNRMFDLVETTENLIWMILTKRPENIAKLAARYAAGWPSNVWLGVSAETQRFANERIPHLIQHPVAVRFVSAGPTLGPVDLRSIPYRGDTDYLLDVLNGRYRSSHSDGWGTAFSFGMGNLRPINWVITEGESGNKPGIRPSHPDWFRTLRDQSVAARVPFHHKQNGEWAAIGQLADSAPAPAARTIRMWPDGRIRRENLLDDLTDGATTLVRVGRERAGRPLDGRVWDEFPAQVRP